MGNFRGQYAGNLKGILGLSAQGHFCGDAEVLIATEDFIGYLGSRCSANGFVALLSTA